MIMIKWCCLTPLLLALSLHAANASQTSPKCGDRLYESVKASFSHCQSGVRRVDKLKFVVTNVGACLNADDQMDAYLQRCEADIESSARVEWTRDKLAALGLVVRALRVSFSAAGAGPLDTPPPEPDIDALLAARAWNDLGNFYNPKPEASEDCVVQWDYYWEGICPVEFFAAADEAAEFQPYLDAVSLDAPMPQ